MSNTPLKLSELQAEIRGTLDERFQGRSWWIIAELQDITDQGNRIFFTFLEKSTANMPLARMGGAVIQPEAIVSFRNFEDITGQKIDQLAGQQVLVRVTVVLHPTVGIRLNTLDISHEYMLGQLEQQRQATFRKLLTKPGIYFTEGKWLTPNKKLQLPSVIQHIAVISSASAAGYEDFAHKLNNNPWRYRFTIKSFFTLVQGDGAAEAMKDELLHIHEQIQKGVQFDAVVIIRGGGAQSDLLPFDSFTIAYPVSRFPIPIITGIGHHKNESITDLMAYTSVKTPTEAAQFILNHNRQFEDALLTSYDELLQTARLRLTHQRLNLEKMTTLLTSGTRLLMNAFTAQLSRIETTVITSSVNYIQNSNNRLKRDQEKLKLSSLQLVKNRAGEMRYLQQRFSLRIPFLFERRNNQLDLAAERIRLLHPENILRRGYAYVMQGEKILTAAQQAQAEQPLIIHFNDGHITTTLIKITPNE